MPLQEAPPTSGVAPGPTAAPVATGPVTLTATEEVWLRVYETDGERLLEKTMTPGERYVVPATAEQPQILTGRPNALRVTVGTTEIPPLGPAERTISDISEERRVGTECISKCRSRWSREVKKQKKKTI